MSPQFIALELSEKLYSESQIHPSDEQAFLVFLLNAGLYQELATFIQTKYLDSDLALPWDFLIEALLKGQFKNLFALLPLLEEGATAQKAFFKLANSPELQLQNHKFKIISQQKDQILQIAYDQKKQSLYSDLHELRNHGLAKAEIEHLQKMLVSFPEDLEIQKAIDDQIENQARERIERYLFRLQNTNRPPPLFETPDEPLPEMEQCLLDLKKIYSQENQETSLYDLALSLFMFEDYQGALETIERISSQLNTDWLKAECLLKLGKNLELMQWLNELELNYLNDPETIFASSYLKAQALWKLGQATLAINMLKKLVEKKPQYRIAQVILNEWQNNLTKQSYSSHASPKRGGL